MLLNSESKLPDMTRRPSCSTEYRIPNTECLKPRNEFVHTHGMRKGKGFRRSQSMSSIFEMVRRHPQKVSRIPIFNSISSLESNFSTTHHHRGKSVTDIHAENTKDFSGSCAEKTRSKSVETLPYIHPESYKNKNISNGRCPQLHATQEELYGHLMKCIRQDDCKTLRSLLKKHELDVNVAVKGKGTLLHEASYKGCLKCIRHLLKCGSYVNSCDDIGFSPLHAAVLGRNKDAVKFLLENNALPNHGSEEGVTSLHVGVLLEDVDVLHELVLGGGDPFITDHLPSPFQMAIDLKKTQALDYFITSFMNLY